MTIFTLHTNTTLKSIEMGGEVAVGGGGVGWGLGVRARVSAADMGAFYY